jgi:hypothetical protein
MIYAVAYEKPDSDRIKMDFKLGCDVEWTGYVQILF